MFWDYFAVSFLIALVWLMVWTVLTEAYQHHKRAKFNKHYADVQHLFRK